jgi:hypothetical protein
VRKRQTLIGTPRQPCRDQRNRDDGCECGERVGRPDDRSLCLCCGESKCRGTPRARSAA